MIPPMDDDLPRPRGDAASLLAKEDLSPYSQDELTERIARHRAEIEAAELRWLEVAEMAEALGA